MLRAAEWHVRAQSDCHFLSPEVALLGGSASLLYELGLAQCIGLVDHGYPAITEAAAWHGLLDMYLVMDHCGVEKINERVLSAEQQDYIAEHLGSPQLLAEKVVEMTIKMAQWAQASLGVGGADAAPAAET